MWEDFGNPVYIKGIIHNSLIAVILDNAFHILKGIAWKALYD